MGRHSMPSVTSSRDCTIHHSNHRTTLSSSPAGVFELSPDDYCGNDEDEDPFLYSPPKIYGSNHHSKPSPQLSSRPLPRPLLAPSPSSRSSSSRSRSSTSSSLSCSTGAPSSPIQLTAAIKITGFRVDIADRNALDALPTQSQSQPQRPQFTPSSRRPSFSASDWVINSVPNTSTTRSGMGAEEMNSPSEDGVDFNKCLMQRLARRSRRQGPQSHPQPIFV